MTGHTGALRRTRIAGTFVLPILITLLGLAGLFYDWATGWSIVAGAMLAWVPNAVATGGWFRARRVRTVPEEAARMRHAEAARWLLTLLGLGILFGGWEGLQPLPFFAAYAVSLAAPLTNHAICKHFSACRLAEMIDGH